VDDPVLDIEPSFALRLNPSQKGPLEQEIEMLLAKKRPNYFLEYYNALEKLKREDKTDTATLADDVVVSCLGTGSMIPSKYRNGKSLFEEFIFFG
jgi:hypothetical protein